MYAGHTQDQVETFINAAKGSDGMTRVRTFASVRGAPAAVRSPLGSRRVSPSRLCAFSPPRPPRARRDTITIEKHEIRAAYVNFSQILFSVTLSTPFALEQLPQAALRAARLVRRVSQNRRQNGQAKPNSSVYSGVLPNLEQKRPARRMTLTRGTMYLSS